MMRKRRLSIGANYPDGMKRIPVTAVLIAALALGVTGCSSGGTLDYKVGIEWHVRQLAALSANVDIEPQTGAVSLPSATGLQRATGEGSSEAAEEQVQQEMKSAGDQFCNNYVDPRLGDPMSSQGLDIIFVLNETVSAAVSGLYTPDLVHAITTTELWLDDNGHEVTDAPMTQTGIANAAKRRADASDEYWNEHHADLIKLRDRVDDERARLHGLAFTPEGVREAQLALTEFCDIVLPPNFHYPSADELRIPVMEDGS